GCGRKVCREYCSCFNEMLCFILFRFPFFFFFQAEDGIRDLIVTGVQTCALPISDATKAATDAQLATEPVSVYISRSTQMVYVRRSEEHTSELQSRSDLVCRLLLEKKKRIP